MRIFLLLTITLLTITNIGAQGVIQLKTDYGSDNNELHELMRFQGIEKITLSFEGESLKGKDYAFIVKEFTNGRLEQTDTIIASSKSDYISKIDTNTFKVDVMIKTRLDSTIKLYAKFNRFSVNKIYDVEKPKDAYALHDFLGANQSLEIKDNTPTYVLGYFLPYIDKETGWKMYCEVSGSNYAPEDWGEQFNIPNYFLVEVRFY
ncbi:hypothetical protein [Pontimicrobium sp. IMCC45349]|uniref:hypothetical protein n=1 Tax=Pontimicrobium sp. IMCC45349 TaxID=3391574 RepID=UPI0039A24559